MALEFLKSLFGKRSTSKVQPHASPADDREFIAFVTSVDAPHFLAPDEILESDQASMRLRVGLPARELARSYRVCLVPISYIEQDPALVRLGKVRAIVVGKLPVSFFLSQEPRARGLLSWVESRALECPIVVDFSDDLGAAAAMYSKPVLLWLQKRLLEACPATVTNEALRERLAPDSRHSLTVIEDPYESSRAEDPRFAPGAILRLVWFGVFGPPLRPFIEAQFGEIARRLCARRIELAFVTHHAQADLVSDMANALRDINAGFSVRWVEWSLSATAHELGQSDIVVLPQDVDSDWGRVKSHNRLVESIRAGRFAVVAPTPAYLELANYAWVGKDLCSGIEWALEHPQVVLSRIAAGQAYVAERFAPSRISAQWARVLGLDVVSEADS
jgi:hypothetical protein